MTVISRSRRQFLIGAGGFSLALPFMQSLLPRGAKAQSYVAPRRFAAYGTSHGGGWGANQCPPDSAAPNRVQLYPDHEIFHGNLQLATSGGRASLAPILSASSSTLTAGMASKLNVLRGLDIPFNIGHNAGGYLGNFAQTDVNPPFAKIPTLDQFLAWSPSFYRQEDLAINKLRSMHVGLDGRSTISWGYANPQSQSGEIQGVPTSFSSKELFDSIFVPPTTDPVAARVPVVDRVLDSYRRLRSGAFGDARRLSSADRQRLDDHLARLAELQRRVNVVASCGDITTPTIESDKSQSGYIFTDPRDLEGTKRFYQAFNEVVAAAFMCGTSRIATFNSFESWSTTPLDWHQDVAHMAEDAADRQQILADAYQQFFEFAFLDLAKRLDVEEAEGRTYLDNSLLMWVQESGPSTHHSICMPVITAGSAGGFLKTGLYVDYRNRVNKSSLARGAFWDRELVPGVLYAQFLGTVAQAMGVPASEFQRDGMAGYGINFTDTVLLRGAVEAAWPQRLFNDAFKVLPLLQA